MVFVKKRRTFRKPKDILTLALKSLWAGEELLCTSRTYGNIRERVDAFSVSHKDRRLATISWGEIKKIRRVA
jgi:hypothetical protein